MDLGWSSDMGRTDIPLSDHERGPDQWAGFAPGGGSLDVALHIPVVVVCWRADITPLTWGGPVSVLLLL